MIGGHGSYLTRYPTLHTHTSTTPSQSPPSPPYYLPSPSTQLHLVNQHGSIIGVIPSTTFLSLSSRSGQILVTVAVALGRCSCCTAASCRHIHHQLSSLLSLLSQASHSEHTPPVSILFLLLSYYLLFNIFT